MPRPCLAPTAPSRPIALAWLILPSALLALSPPAAAERCLDEWTAPVVCHLELSVAEDGERRASRIDGRKLELASRSTVDLFVAPYDQWDRRFPLERFEVRIEPDRRCRDLLTITRREQGRFRIEAGSRDGACDLVLWVPGNLNLDRELTVEVDRGRRAGYSLRGGRAHRQGALPRPARPRGRALRRPVGGARDPALRRRLGGPRDAAERGVRPHPQRSRSDHPARGPLPGAARPATGQRRRAPPTWTTSAAAGSRGSPWTSSARRSSRTGWPAKSADRRRSRAHVSSSTTTAVP